MNKLGKEQVLLLYQYLTEQTGGTVGLRDAGLLESAIESVYATFDGKELCPTKEEKAARLGFNLVSNHAFLDGNKRIGMYVMITFLKMGGVKLNCTNEEVVSLGLGLASGKKKYEDALAWILKHKIGD